MKKPTVYIDTNVVSVLHYGGTELDTLSRRMATRDWFESERRYFELWSSIVTERELADGLFQHQFLVSPDTIPRVHLGQPIRRPKHD